VRFPEGLVGGDDDARPLVAGGDELEEQVGGFAVEGDVADLVDDEQRGPPQPRELGVQASFGVGVAEASHPLRGGGEGDAMSGLTGPDAQARGQVGLAGAGRAEEHDVVLGLDEVERAEMGDHLALEASLVVEVEVLEALDAGNAIRCSAVTGDFDPPWGEWVAGS